MDINRSNYETFFLLYLDRELEPAKMGEVEKFLRENSDLQREFSLLQQTVFSPAQILFDQKESLLHHEEKRRPVPLYWMRAAASVVLLAAGGWLLTGLMKNHKITQAGDHNLVAKVVPQIPAKVQVVQEKQSEQPVVKIPVTHSGYRSRQASPAPLKKQMNADGQQTDQVPDEPAMAMRKSSAVLEVQSAAYQPGPDTKPVVISKEMNMQTLLIAANNPDDQLKYKNALLKEADFQSDDAISVVALNDRNKAISGFFKKLTKRAPAEDNSRKLRVSVFQINY
jgi:hypothetical protein